VDCFVLTLPIFIFDFSGRPLICGLSCALPASLPRSLTRFSDSAGVIVKVELDVVQVLDFKGTGANERHYHFCETYYSIWGFYFSV
jgi:hypothetical protein